MTFVKGHKTNVGRQFSAEHKGKIATALKGNQNAKGYKHSEESIEKRVRQVRGVKFSKRRRELISKNHADVSGKNNPNWNGGHSPERQSKYAKVAWKELAKSIRKRDGCQCQDCNSPHSEENKLIVHHIKEWSKYPKLRFEPTNLITLCELCHRIRHGRRKKS